MVHKIATPIILLLLCSCAHLPGTAGPPGSPPSTAAIATHEGTYDHDSYDSAVSALSGKLDVSSLDDAAADDPDTAPSSKLIYDSQAGWSAKGTEGETLLSFSDADTTPDVSNGGTGVASTNFQTANTGSTTITDFDDGDNHSEFTEGDWFTLRVDDSNTILDFATDGNIRRGDGSGLNFIGSADYPYVLEFRYTATFWLCTNIPPGLSSPTSYASSSFGKANTILDSDGRSLSAAEMFNTIIMIASGGSGTYNLAAIADGANVSFSTESTGDVLVNPDDSDTITYCKASTNTCTAATAGEAIKLTDAGEMAVCVYGGTANKVHCDVSANVVEETP